MLGKINQINPTHPTMLPSQDEIHMCRYTIRRAMLSGVRTYVCVLCLSKTARPFLDLDKLMPKMENNGSTRDLGRRAKPGTHTIKCVPNKRRAGYYVTPHRYR